jgi:alpha-L-fucosidase
MFDTRQTDFSIARGPFASHPKADVARWVFDSFRRRGFMTGAYFSKPDWHSQYYWWDKYATPTRNVNYDITKNRWRWNQFKQFTHRQIEELMSGYGPLDILWLDGGWVCPRPSNPALNQDIDMASMAAMARRHQPGLLVVDRTVHGPYENYQTPEQAIPSTQLTQPWETCMTLGRDWGHVPGQPLKSAARVVHSLVEIVAKGGSLLLGVGPTPEGLIAPNVVERLAEIGRWTSANGRAIYGTRPTEHYNDGRTWFTRSRDGRALYSIHCVEGEMPKKISWRGNTPEKGSKVVLLQTGRRVRWSAEGDVTTVTVPAGLAADLPALAFEIVKQ